MSKECLEVCYGLGYIQGRGSVFEILQCMLNANSCIDALCQEV
jgi:hypothetical protein